MGEFSRLVGQRIRKYRKLRGYTVEQFAQMIGKSKATLSKYENGAVAMDIEVLGEISRVLDVELKSLTDFPLAPVHRQSLLMEQSYFNQPLAYLYYYDGRTNQLVRSLLHLSPAPASDDIDATLYVGLASFEAPDRCQHLFVGKLLSYDTITHIVLTNQINPAERMYICLLNPLQTRTPAVGLLSGISSTPFFAPIALKVLIAKTPLEESDKLLSSIKLDKEDMRFLKHYNMMVFNRPSSLPLI